ncbi:MAG: DivIVA domain-containing protein [Oscillospiraceae bacterium]|jgi:cell division initiation protein|nr:DivIVA domain-containing protein [Oscillospiraceae bacterium]
MLSIEEIKNITFRKAVKGYMPDDVDVFIDEVIKTVEQLKKEKNVLIGKMDFLAKRVEQYREEEETVKNALIAAHKMAEGTIADAKTEADAIIANAKKEADQLMAQAQKDTKQQKENYKAIQKDTVALREEVLDIYRRHLEIIKTLPTDAEAQKTQEKLDEKYPTPTANNADFDYLQAESFDLPAEQDAAATAEFAPEPAATTRTPADEVEISSARVPAKKQPPAGSKQEKFANLKFGDNYDVND